MALIGDLIISLQYFEAQGKLQERKTITDLNAHYLQVDKRTYCKRIVLNIGVAFLMCAIIGEILFRFFFNYEDALIILDVQLVILGICLLFETLAFVSISKRVFQGEFKEEQKFFQTSLLVFLTTYTIRSALLVIVICMWSKYVQWYENMPLFAATIQSLVHLIYDAFPVLHLML